MSSDTPKLVCLHQITLQAPFRAPDLRRCYRSSPRVLVIFGSPASRLIVRRVRRLNTVSRDGAEQDELLPAWRYHAVFTNSPLQMLDAEAAHRGHAIIEQVIAELKDGPLAHLPSGNFTANAAWLAMASVAFNLTRAAGTLASTLHAKARRATLRAQLINISARVARSARRVTLHLPTGWPWRSAWQQLDQRTRGTPLPATP